MLIFININTYKNDENKLSILKYIPEKYLPITDKLKRINKDNIKYPFIVKPNVCTMGF